MAAITAVILLQDGGKIPNMAELALRSYVEYRNSFHTKLLNRFPGNRKHKRITVSDDGLVQFYLIYMDGSRKNVTCKQTLTRESI